MQPLMVLTVFTGLIDLLIKLLPELEKAFGSGEITDAQQEEVRAKLNALREDSKFLGPEWEA